MLRLPKYGKIEKGNFANFVVWDPLRLTKFNLRDLKT